MDKLNKQQILMDVYEKFIYTIGVVCQNNREKSIAITNAETAYLWAKKSLEENEQK
ncbi:MULTISPECIES: hypothetical protein [unclassified Bacillus cereus group]|uniref:hypothetical protein n=1 Tax=Bacillus cereus group TaxID=86661 RepID=UPI0022E5F131|nr:MULTISPECIES: hypothetical protein [unclassified Bacillus cereus group]WAI24912.1 MAG: hypothetical protein NRZ50_18065 [Bacillus paranthracis]MDA2667145.1 hypothetical protein [Bacillus cereus group sp. Bc032]MDA2677846.1 hypothetical protein [Bacillus cereus group sp. Bc031]MDA2683356.1 hypothetical protein [Bacillus cereus group sp. Bc029]MDA2688791.1 hypothetical protein [Bacillus cereus group sp. Bc030]